MNWAQRIIRLTIALSILLIGVGAVAFIFWQLGIFSQFKNISEFGNSPYGLLMYFTTYLAVKLSFFLPLGPIVIAFNQVGSDLMTFLVGSAGEIVGGLILYGLGITIGVKLIKWIADEKTLNKWKDIMERGKYTIFLSLLFPFSPNQLVMMLCGSGKMKMRQYLPMIMIAQPIGVLTTIYFGKGLFELIKLPTVLLVPIGIAGFLAIAGIMYLSFKYQDKIDWAVGKLRRNK